MTKHQARDIEFAEPPIEGWGAGALALDEWRRNDGAVSVIPSATPPLPGQNPSAASGSFHLTPDLNAESGIMKSLRRPRAAASIILTS